MAGGLAWVIIGGLISSLFLTLVEVKVMYALFDKRIARVRRGKKEVPIEKLMVAHYKPRPLHEHEFDPSHI